jgi:lipopolysaccharide biosynthesis protein
MERAAPDATELALNAPPLTNPRLIAFFLPQFHPIPENDRWWGKGFTEWSNVTKAQPLFKGHYQPHLPADLGFYDLRLREIRHEQIQLARQYGIDGFCYHYYWFSGKRLLNKPIDDMYADAEADMPYCFCWANENWTRRWDGAEHEVLISQSYHPDDALNFIKDMVKYFQDPRYIKLDGGPILIVYRPQHLRDPQRTTRIWREYCASVGIEKIHLCAALVCENDDYASNGFDSGVQFPPHAPRIPALNTSIHFYEPFKGFAMDYIDFAHSYLTRSYPSRDVHLTVVPSWDNTARVRDRAFILIHSSPHNYRSWLASAIRKTREDFPDRQGIVFITAWTEWAEGCHLEPDRKYGHQFLEATLQAKLHRDKPLKMRAERESTVSKERFFLEDLQSVFEAHKPIMRSRIRTNILRTPVLRDLRKVIHKFRAARDFLRLKLDH